LRALTCICVLTVLCIGTTELYAQSTGTTDPLETMPIRFGMLGLSPTLAVTNLGIDDNIFNDATDPKRDFTMTVTPRLQSRFRTGKVLLSGTVATGLVYYQTYDDERSIDYTADGRVDVDLGWFQPYALASLLDTRERLNVELDDRAPRTQTAFAAGARMLLSPKTGIVVDFRQAGLDFAEGTTFDGVPLSQSLNSTTKTLEGGLEFYLTPLTTFSVVASRQTDRFDQALEKDADTFRILPTIRMEAPAIIRGSLAVGYRRFSAIDPETPDYGGLVMQGSLTHTFGEQTKVDLSLSRDVQYSFEETEPYYLTTGLRVVLTQQLGGAFDLRAIVGRDRLDYREEATSGVPNDSRVDRASVIGAGAGYRFQSNLRTGVDVEYAKRTSEVPNRQYDRTRVFASMTYGF
jgi:Putative beta-barrel porin 2